MELENGFELNGCFFPCFFWIFEYRLVCDGIGEIFADVFSKISPRHCAGKNNSTPREIFVYSSFFFGIFDENKRKESLRNEHSGGKKMFLVANKVSLFEQIRLRLYRYFLIH